MNKSFYKKVVWVALPIIIQNFIGSLVNVIDTVMVGKLGEKAIASVGIGNQYFFLLNILLLGTFSGISIFTAQYWGKKDVESIKKLLGIGMIFALIIGGLFTLIGLIFPEQIVAIFNQDIEVIKLGGQYITIICISYIFTALSFNYAMALRCIEKTSLPMISTVIALGINVFLNWIFIFGNLGFKAMGVEGSALATLISRIIELLILVIYIYWSKDPLAGKFKELFAFNKKFIKVVIITMIPVVLNEGCWGLGSIMYNIIFGRIGTKEIAAVQIATTINNLFMVIILGIASAALVIVGGQIGKGYNEKGYEYGKKIIKLGCIIGVFLALGLVMLSSNLLSIFDVSDQVRDWAKYILYVIAIVMVIRVFNIIVIVGVLRGGGDAKASLIIEASTMWLIGVPLTFIGAFIFNLPIYMIYALSTIEELVKMFICFKRFVSKKWINNLV